MALNQALRDATQAILNGGEERSYLRTLHKGIARINGPINPGNSTIVEFTSGTPYYVYRTQDGRYYSLIHSTTTFNKQKIYVVHTVVQNLDDIFDPVTGFYKGLWEPQNLGGLDDLDDLDDQDD